LRKRIEKFIDDVRNVTNGGQIALRWRNELHHHRDRTNATLKLYTSKFRKAIIQELGETHPALKYVRLGSEITAKIRQDYKASVALENRHLVKIDKWEKVLAHSRRLLRAENPRQVAIGLMLLTGRRSYEVCCTADFSPHKIGRRTFDKWHVDFRGQAKTRGRPGTHADDFYTVPCLAPAKEVIRAHRALREADESAWWADLDNDKFTNMLQSQLSTQTKREFAPYWPQDELLTTKCLRALYAEIACHFFAPKHMTKSSFFAKILGHSEEDIETSLTYFDYYLSDEELEPMTREIAAIKAQLQSSNRARGIEPDEAGEREPEEV